LATLPSSTLTLAGSDLTLSGQVCRMNAGGIAVQLESDPEEPAALAAGTKVVAELALQHGHYEAEAAIISYEPPSRMLLVGLTEPIRPRQRRGAKRLNAALFAKVRPLFPDGKIDAWQDSSTLDVSAGGVRLELRKCDAEPYRVEMKLSLPGERLPIAVMGRVAHCRSLGAGRCIVGVQFLNLSAPDSARLVGHIESLPTEAEMQAA
jgi:hypothetical protein